MKRLLPFLALIVLAGCASDEPPPAKYVASPAERIVLNVGAVNIVDHSNFQPSTSPYYVHRLEPTIAQAVRQWVTDNVQAGGTQGQAMIVIKDASLTSETLPMSDATMDRWFKRQQSSKYSGHVEVSVEVQGASGSYGLATAQASRSVTLPEAPTEAERKNLYVTLLNGLMRDFGQSFNSSLREHLPNYVLGGSFP